MNEADGRISIKSEGQRWPFSTVWKRQSHPQRVQEAVIDTLMVKQSLWRGNNNSGIIVLRNAEMGWSFFSMVIVGNPISGKYFGFAGGQLKWFMEWYNQPLSYGENVLVHCQISSGVIPSSSSTSNWRWVTSSLPISILKFHPFNKVITGCGTQRCCLHCSAMSWVSDYEDQATSSLVTQGGHGLVI